MNFIANVENVNIHLSFVKQSSHKYEGKKKLHNECIFIAYSKHKNFSYQNNFWTYSSSPHILAFCLKLALPLNLIQNSKHPWIFCQPKIPSWLLVRVAGAKRGISWSAKISGQSVILNSLYKLSLSLHQLHNSVVVSL